MGIWHLVRSIYQFQGGAGGILNLDTRQILEFQIILIEAPKPHLAFRQNCTLRVHIKTSRGLPVNT